MTANTNPVFTSVPNVGWSIADGDGGAAGPIKTANTAMDGTGTVNTIFTAGANGSWVEDIVARPAGTNVATVLRIFLNNGSTHATPANNTLIAELSIPATTASNSQAQPDYTRLIRRAIDPGYKILVTIGTTIAAGIQATAFGGDY